MSKSNGNGHRDGAGRFLPGTPAGPGRAKGSSTESTQIARKLKDAILAHSTEPVDGKPRIIKLLDQLASGDPVEYVKRVCSILPKDLDVKGEFTHEITDGIAGLCAAANEAAKARRAELANRMESN